VDGVEHLPKEVEEDQEKFSGIYLDMILVIRVLQKIETMGELEFV